MDGQTIKQLRRKAGLTQNQLADKMFVTTDSVKKWEAGLRNPNKNRLPRLNTVLKVGL